MDQEVQLFNITVDSQVIKIQSRQNTLIAFTEEQIIYLWKFSYGYTVLFALRDFRLSYLLILLIIPVYFIYKKKGEIEISTNLSL